MVLELVMVRQCFRSYNNVWLWKDNNELPGILLTTPVYPDIPPSYMCLVRTDAIFYWSTLVMDICTKDGN